MRLGPSVFTNADYEGRYLVSWIDENGLTGEFWADQDDVDEIENGVTENTCDKNLPKGCCHPKRTHVVKGRVVEGKMNGTPIEQIVRTKESGW